MKIIALLKNSIVFIIFLVPIILFPQNENGLILNEKLPNNIEKFGLIFHNQELLGVPITLFNKTTSKVTVGNYGDAKITKRTPSETTTKIFGITYIETKFKFFIDFNNSLNESSKLIGTKINSDFSETIKATITTGLKNSKSWDFIVKIDKINFSNIDIGRLTEGERTIEIIRTDFLQLKNNNEYQEAFVETQFYEFIENGISLGAVTFDNENSIWLKSGLDATTKLILCTAMLSIAN
jgi:hypothetical protein